MTGTDSTDATVVTGRATAVVALATISEIFYSSCSAVVLTTGAEISLLTLLVSLVISSPMGIMSGGI